MGNYSTISALTYLQAAENGTFGPDGKGSSVFEVSRRRPDGKHRWARFCWRSLWPAYWRSPWYAATACIEEGGSDMKKHTTKLLTILLALAMLLPVTAQAAPTGGWTDEAEQAYQTVTQLVVQRVTESKDYLATATQEENAKNRLRPVDLRRRRAGRLL